MSFRNNFSSMKFQKENRIYNYIKKFRTGRDVKIDEEEMNIIISSLKSLKIDENISNENRRILQ